MSKFAVALSLAGLMGVVVTPSLAQDGIPDLTGAWSMTQGTTILADGTVNQHPDDFDGHIIEITKQTGPVFTATQRIKPKADTKTGNHAGTPYTGQATPMIGVIDGRGPQVVIADVGDTTTYQCSLEDEQTMRCTFSEAGDHAVAGLLVLKRGQ